MYNSLIAAGMIVGWLANLAAAAVVLKTRVRQAREERRWNAYMAKGDEAA